MHDMVDMGIELSFNSYDEHSLFSLIEINILIFITILIMDY